jgi:organic hydroperoxide reductase OsmC/OhrA
VVYHLRTVHDATVAVGWAGQRTLTIDRSEQTGGMGLSYSGGELLLLAIGACYCNDIFREAAVIGISVRAVAVDVSCDWGGESVRAQHVSLAARVEAEAGEDEIRSLMEQTDRVAEIPNSMRLGTPVTLTALDGVPMPPRGAG